MPGLNVPGDRRGARRSARPVRQEQKTVSLHATLAMRARGSSEGRCYKTAASNQTTDGDRVFGGTKPQRYQR